MNDFLKCLIRCPGHLSAIIMWRGGVVFCIIVFYIYTCVCVLHHFMSFKLWFFVTGDNKVALETLKDKAKAFTGKDLL